MPPKVPTPPPTPYTVLSPSLGPTDTEVETLIHLHYSGHFAFSTLTQVSSTLQMKPIWINNPTYEA